MNLEDAIRSLEKRTEALFHRDISVDQVGQLNMEATRLWLSHKVVAVVTHPNMDGYSHLSATEFIKDFPTSLLHRLEVVISTLDSAFLPFNSDEKELMKNGMVRVNGWRNYTADYYSEMSGSSVPKKMLQDYKDAQDAGDTANGNW
jgi:hypothetical protein